jgi:hypothetical protein
LVHDTFVVRIQVLLVVVGGDRGDKCGETHTSDGGELAGQTGVDDFLGAGDVWKDR